ncbi:TraG family conjugative transposon ATPase [Paraflavitalea sp. CAU 1676]|uniref:TraG family conjugative transposon ATPase n=1 Tax=Paraflavitalea sp. CAU 1676 TaxID=3032598 RepID=UPI0023D9803D|nr:TraG family conjugative transposon ATPase [Paraflavitalea sp. CAU 1676]MDF2191365.1 TraG family conjugative transposon ATPase [Paraflavitalea sp. CAU 1676]
MQKIRQLEQVFPIWKIEKNCIISRQGDLTIAFELKLPELFTLSEEEYDVLHFAWLKAIRLLPPHSILHKQDWFLEARYRAKPTTEEKPFLTQASDRHFFERPYLEHSCYLYLTKRANLQKNLNPLTMFSNLKSPIPKGMLDARETNQFLEVTTQFAAILQDTGYIKVRRVKDEELVSSIESPGLLEQYCFLMAKDDQPIIKDIQFNPDFQIGEQHVELYSLTDINDLPNTCGPKTNYERYSTDKSRFPVSFAAPLGQLLPGNHIVNQYLLIENTPEVIKKLESKRLRLQSLSTYSRENTLSRDAVNAFLNEAISQQRLPVKAHINLITWTTDKTQQKNTRNAVAAAFAQLDAKAKQETIIAQQLFFAGVPGAASQLPIFETFETFAEQASCFFIQETTSRSTPSPTGIRFGERITGRPLHVDITHYFVGTGVIQNRNKFLVGPSGSGKSFLTQHILRSYYEQGSHILIVDVGHSYSGLCELVKGYYFTYTPENPIKFNPFYLGDEQLDTEKKESIKTLLLALWKKDSETYSRSEYVSISNALQNYFTKLDQDKSIRPCFNTFYEFLRDEFVNTLKDEGVSERHFDIQNFLYVLKPYYCGGEYDYLLNATENLDLLNERFLVFELDNIKEHPILYTVATLTLAQAFIDKMRKLKGVHKVILLEEAWKAIAKNGMAEYIKYLYKTVRKFQGEAITVTQEVDDIIGNSIVKDAIINNSDCKILLDQSKYLNKFQHIQELLGLTDKEKNLVLSLNKSNEPNKKYKEVFISLGGTISRVYRTEVSLEEYLAYTTEEKEKIKVREYAQRYGSLQKGITALAAEIRDAQS